MTDAKRVPIWGKPQGFVTVEPGATAGATFGVNLRWPNGSLVKLTDFQQTTTESGSQFSYWIQIADVPANVKAIANLSGTGIVRKTGDGALDAASTTTDLPEGSNLYFTSERVDDRVSSLLKPGSNVTLTYDDTAGTLTIAASGSGPAALTLTASGAISALRMVVAEAGAGRYPDTSVAADAGRVVGMATTSAASGDPFDVLTNGEYTDAGWSWSPGPVFCGASGVLTQTVGTGWVLEVGRALSATRILIDVKTPLLRN